MRFNSFGLQRSIWKFLFNSHRLQMLIDCIDKIFFDGDSLVCFFPQMVRHLNFNANQHVQLWRFLKKQK